MRGDRRRGGTGDASAMPFPVEDHPRVQLKYVDAGDLYVTWRWEHALDRPRAHAIPRAAVQPALDELEQAVPSPHRGEDLHAALDRAFRGALAEPARERTLAAGLAAALIPAPLAGELNALLVRGLRPHVRVQPSVSLGRVPWEALLVDEGRRLVHEADVSLLAPAGVRNAPGRRVSGYDPRGTVVAVLDPPVPGGVLGPVLGPVAPGSALERMRERIGTRARGAEPLIGGEIGRIRLRALLEDAARLVYVGHVSSATYGLDVRLHLSDGPEAVGRAEMIGAHRPLTAADIAFGAGMPGDDGPWRIPSRVALLACDSGGDAGFAEPTALVSVLARGGAEHVTGARWTLPTDAGFARAGAEAPVFSTAVAAVDAAHEAEDPIAALNAWQRDRAEDWDRTGALVHSPLMWAAFSTTWSPHHA